MRAEAGVRSQSKVGIKGSGPSRLKGRRELVPSRRWFQFASHSRSLRFLCFKKLSQEIGRRKMLGFRVLLACIAALSLCACNPPAEHASSADDQPERISKGGNASPSGFPCVGELCLGRDGAQHVSECSENISVSSALELKHCSLRDSVAVGGITSLDGLIVLLDGAIARAVFRFPASSCVLLQSSLRDSFGESSAYVRSQDSYRVVFQSVGDDSASRIGMASSAQVWETTNGRFVFARNMVVETMDFDCMIHVDSKTKMYDVLRKSRDQSGGSFRG